MRIQLIKPDKDGAAWRLSSQDPSAHAQFEGAVSRASRQLSLFPHHDVLKQGSVYVYDLEASRGAILGHALKVAEILRVNVELVL